MKNARKGRLIKWPLLGALVLGGLAFAIDYQVDGAGGPEGLSERVERAVRTWRAVEGGGFDLQEADDAPNRILYGDGPAFGPDTLSLTVVRGPDPATDVLLNPTEPSERALLHELGLLAGLSTLPGERAVMNPAVPQEADAELTPADEAALRALETFVPEDINQDGVVDFYDLADFGDAFGETGVSLPADINDSGTVDRADLELLTAAYTFGAPAENPPEGALASGGVASGGAASGGAVSGGAASGGATSGGAASGGG